MKVNDYIFRNYNIVDIISQLEVSYPPLIINNSEILTYKRFNVYFNKDTKTYQFVIDGIYTNKQKKVFDKVFCVSVEEVSHLEYDSKLIQKVFFAQRSLITSLIQAFFGGFVEVMQLQQEVKTVEKTDTVEVKFYYDDTFVQEDTKIIEKEDEIEVIDNPIIILDKKPAGRPKGVLNKKKTTKRTTRKVANNDNRTNTTKP